MAVTPTPVLDNVVLGNERMTVTAVALDVSYPTGGYPLTPAQLRLQSVAVAITDIKLDGGSGAATAVWYDTVNQKLKLYTATAEVANAVDLSADAIQIVALGY